MVVCNSHARVGHRQGSYKRQPRLARGGVLSFILATIMSDIHPLLATARQLHRRGHADAAAATYSLALRGNPTLGEAHAYLATHALQRGEFADAVAHGEHAVNADQNDVQAHIDLGAALSELKKFEHAEDILAAIEYAACQTDHVVLQTA